MPIVSELYTYPLKSAQGLLLSSVEFEAKGPKFDRQWMVINKKKRFITQRQHPKMCLIKANIQDKSLSLDAPDMPTININSNEVRNKNHKTLVTIWADNVEALDCGDHAAQWVSSYLGIDEGRLVYMPNETQRLVDTDFASKNETVSFADGFPSLLISQESLNHFNSKLDQPIQMANFRPNIVISDCEPYAEDQWQEIKIAGITFSLVKPCSRCIIPSIDQSTAVKQPEVTGALNKYRRRDRATYFGQNALHDSTGFISVGDNVEILR